MTSINGDAESSASGPTQGTDPPGGGNLKGTANAHAKGMKGYAYVEDPEDVPIVFDPISNDSDDLSERGQSQNKLVLPMGGDGEKDDEIEDECVAKGPPVGVQDEAIQAI